LPIDLWRIPPGRGKAEEKARQRDDTAAAEAHEGYTVFPSATQRAIVAAEIWIFLIIVVGALAAVGGVIYGRRGGPSQSELDQLQLQLDAARSDAAKVQGNVTEHFERSALLFGRLAHDYRDFLEHFSESAKELGISEIQARELLERADLPLLGNQREVIETAPESTPEEPPLMEDVVAPSDTQASAADTPPEDATSKVVEVDLDAGSSAEGAGVDADGDAHTHADEEKLTQSSR
jgi:uncharacterized membrane-anchored protein YhcB (DUF1043 family)